MKQCTNCGQQVQDNFNNCPYCGAPLPQVQQHGLDLNKQEEKWFYAEGQQSTGPFTEQAIAQMIQQGIINQNTQVWAKGMENWQPITTTELNKLFNQGGYQQNQYPQQNNMMYNNTPNPNMQNQGFRGNRVGLSERNGWLYLLLSIVTCGIWYYIWLYNMAEDVNKILRFKGKQEMQSGGMVILLSIVTCGLFIIYYFWKVGQTLANMEVDGVHLKDNSTVFLVCALFIPIVDYFILQDMLNDVATHNV